MEVGDLPLMTMLKDRMAWLGRRQDVLSQNVASADVPGYRPHDLKPQDFETTLKSATRISGVSLAVTDPHHISISQDRGGFEETENADTGASPNGNAVSLEAQMMKVADTQAQFQAAANLYAKAITMMKTAIGRSS
ncbi:MAG TPA: flagellar basal body rod protein FlgB [Rhizomicrobium sp.]|nr:flagellar basal body rod protein FlgB [Rhizomicrobium sp.]